jgi:hypothetical protein
MLCYTSGQNHKLCTITIIFDPQMIFRMQFVSTLMIFPPGFALIAPAFHFLSASTQMLNTLFIQPPCCNFYLKEKRTAGRNFAYISNVFDNKQSEGPDLNATLTALTAMRPPCCYYRLYVTACRHYNSRKIRKVLTKRQYCIPEDLHHQQRHCENLKSHTTNYKVRVTSHDMKFILNFV